MKQFSKDDQRMTDRHEKVFNMTSHQGHATKTLNSIFLTQVRRATIKETNKSKEKKAKM